MYTHTQIWELHIHENFRDRENEVYIIFSAKDAVKHLGVSEGRKVILKIIRKNIQ